MLLRTPPRGDPFTPITLPAPGTALTGMKMAGTVLCTVPKAPVPGSEDKAGEDGGGPRDESAGVPGWLITEPPRAKLPLGTALM